MEDEGFRFSSSPFPESIGQSWTPQSHASLSRSQTPQSSRDLSLNGFSSFPTPQTLANIGLPRAEHQQNVFPSSRHSLDTSQSSFRDFSAEQQISYYRDKSQRLQEENSHLRGQLSELRSNYGDLLDTVKQFHVSAASQGTTGQSGESYFDPSAPDFPCTPLEQCSKVKYYTFAQYKEEFNKRKATTKVMGDKKKTRKGDENNMTWYVEDRNGKAVPPVFVGNVRQTYRELWNFMLRHNVAPPTWSQIDIGVKKLFTREVCTKYPELSYGEGNWKVDQVAKDNYPSWYANHAKVVDEDSKKINKRGKSVPSTAVGPSKRRRVSDDDPGEDSDTSERSDNTHQRDANTLKTSTAVVSSTDTPLPRLSTSPPPVFDLDDPLVDIFPSSTASSQSIHTPLQVLLAAAALDDPAHAQARRDLAPPQPSLRLQAQLSEPENGLPAAPLSVEPPTLQITNNGNSTMVPAITATLPAAVLTATTTPSAQPLSRPVTPIAPITQHVAQTQAPASHPPLDNPPEATARKSRRARAGKGNTTKNICKRAWITEHTSGTEQEFKEFWSSLDESGQQEYLKKVSQVLPATTATKNI